jgi:hypothetical protein
MENEGGRVSEWNEGAFKSTRLHSIQENINFLWSNPLGITEGKFNFEWLISQINILYGEGYSKYSPTERKETDKLMDLVDSAIQYLPPTQIITSEGIQTSEKSFVVNEERFRMLLRLIKDFERKVKDLNDKHGLTTQNRQEEGGFD